jgi:hypothetical protein
MLYNDLIDYNQSGIQYNGTIVLIIEGVSNPVILNDIKVNFGGKEDYSVASSIGVISIDLAPTGVITIQALGKEGAALIQASEITIHSGTIITIETLGNESAGIIQTS